MSLRGGHFLHVTDEWTEPPGSWVNFQPLRIKPWPVWLLPLCAFSLPSGPTPVEALGQKEALEWWRSMIQLPGNQWHVVTEAKLLMVDIDLDMMRKIICQKRALAWEEVGHSGFLKRVVMGEARYRDTSPNEVGIPAASFFVISISTTGRTNTAGEERCFRTSERRHSALKNIKYKLKQC